MNAVITQICETGDTGVLLPSSHNRNLIKKNRKRHQDISALLIPVLSAPQRGRNSISSLDLHFSFHTLSASQRTWV